MKVSVCITVFNEEKSISKLLSSLLGQSRIPDEIVIVDGGSSDKTVDIIRHWQKRNNKIKFLVEKCSRAKGRNLAVELSKSDIIAMTDAGCIPKRDWLKNIVEPLKQKEIDIVAGFYEMTDITGSYPVKTRVRPLQKSFSVFLGIHPEDFNINFLPSTRSIAFRRRAWEKIGGFPEKLIDTAEDTVFNYRAIKEGLSFARVKNARVEWKMPTDFSEGIRKIFYYAKGDAKSGIWFYPLKGLVSHNIKALSIFIRYLIGFFLLVLGFTKPMMLLVLFLLLILCSFWSFRKVYIKVGDLRAGLWGVVVQFASDFAVMSGFLSGVLGR